MGQFACGNGKGLRRNLCKWKQLIQVGALDTTLDFHHLKRLLKITDEMVGENVNLSALRSIGGSAVLRGFSLGWDHSSKRLLDSTSRTASPAGRDKIPWKQKSRQARAGAVAFRCWKLS